MVQLRKELIIVVTFFIMAYSLYILSPGTNPNLGNNLPQTTTTTITGKNQTTHTQTQTPNKNQFNETTSNKILTQSPNNNNNNNNTNSNNTTKPNNTNDSKEGFNFYVNPNNASVPKYYSKEEHGLNNNNQRSKYAYSFYITKDDYFCAALINAHNIRKSSIQDIVIHMVEEGHLSDLIYNNFKHVPNVYFRFVPNVLPKAGNRNSFWIQTWNKYWVFKLTDYQRVIHADADTYILKNLDHLFELPDSIIAMPRAYWLRQPFASSLLMVIKPSEDLYNLIILHGNNNNPTGNSWDMDVLNQLFGSSSDFIMLPGIYSLLHGEFSNSEKHWFGDQISTTWDRAPLIHWSTFKPWAVDGNSVAVTGHGELYRKTWTLWKEGFSNFCSETK